MAWEATQRQLQRSWVWNLPIQVQETQADQGGKAVKDCFKICFAADELQPPSLLKKRQDSPLGVLKFNFDNNWMFVPRGISIQPRKYKRDA